MNSRFLFIDILWKTWKILELVTSLHNKAKNKLQMLVVNYTNIRPKFVLILPRALKHKNWNIVRTKHFSWSKRIYSVYLPIIVPINNELSLRKVNVWQIRHNLYWHTISIKMIFQHKLEVFGHWQFHVCHQFSMKCCCLICFKTSIFKPQKIKKLAI